MQMPKIDLDLVDLTPTERTLAQEIFKANGTLYASKPGKASGEGKYLWRMVAFGVSPHAKHHCLPVTAYFDLGGEYSEVMDRSKELDDLATKLEQAVPVLERHGTMQWGRVLGRL